jgi:hypothetical protein
MSTTGTLRPDGEYGCDGITTRAQHCTRKATVHLAKDNGECVAHYCRAHSRGAGVMRMLLPRPWEYDHVEVYS